MKRVLEVEIKSIGEGNTRWFWSLKLNRLWVSSINIHGTRAGLYTTPLGAREAFNRWLEGANEITSRIYRTSYAGPNIEIRFKVVE